MARIFQLTSQENEFLRLLLLDSIRHYSRALDDDKNLLSSCIFDDKMSSVFISMRDNDFKNFTMCKSLYSKLLDASIE